MITADHAATSPWEGILKKPKLFPPSAHKHLLSDITRSGAEEDEVAVFDGRQWTAKPLISLRLTAIGDRGSSTLQETLILFSDNLQSVADKALTLETNFNESATRFENRITLIAQEGSASAQELHRLTTIVGDSSAKITRFDSALSTQTSALARTTLELKAAIGVSDAAITDIRSTFATRQYAEAKKQEAIRAAYARNAASYSSITTAYADADQALSDRIDVLSTSSGSHIYRQGTAPTGANVGDYWIDSSSGNRPSVWNGTAWVDARETDLTATMASVTTILSSYASTTYVNASISTAVAAGVASANGYTNGQISSLSSVYATPTSVTSALSTAIGAEVTARNSAISSSVTTEATARASADGNLSSKYTLTVAAGDVVTGLNLTSSLGPGLNTARFAIQADRFQINTSTGGNKEIFSATSTAVKLGDVLTVDLAGQKVFIGTGTYNNAATPFYVDAAGKFSLKNKFVWDGTNLTIDGDGTFTGDITGASGTFSGDLSASSGVIGGFTINSTRLYSPAVAPNIMLDSSGYLQAGVDAGYSVTLSFGQIEFYDGYGGGFGSVATLNGTSGNLVINCISGDLNLTGGNVNIDGDLNFTTGGGAVKLTEDWGLVYEGNGFHPFKTSGASIYVGGGSPATDYGSGNIYIAGYGYGDFTSFSTRLWKDNIRPLTGAAEKLRGLAGWMFEYNANAPERMRGRTDIGVIAEDVEVQQPELVVRDASNTLAVNYPKFAPLLIEGWKDHDGRITALETENTSLRTRLEALEAA